MFIPYYQELVKYQVTAETKVSIHHHSFSCVLLTFYSVPVILLTTRLYIQKFCMVITLHLCALYGSQKSLLSYTSLTD